MNIEAASATAVQIMGARENNNIMINRQTGDLI